MNIEDMKYDIEITMANECYYKEKQAKKDGLEHKCTCEDPYKWSDEEVKEYWEEHCAEED